MGSRKGQDSQSLKCRVLLRQEAENDLAAAYDWYESRVTGLGQRFLEYLDIAMRSLEWRPLMHRDVWPGVRRALTDRFPYSVYFQIQGDHIEIIAILHQSRDQHSMVHERARDEA